MDVGRLFVVNILLLIFLSACEDNNNHGYGFDYDLISQAGIGIIFEDEPIPIDTDFIDYVYYESLACTGLEGSPPDMVIKRESFYFDYDGESYRAATLFNPSLILLGSSYTDDFGVLMHEFLHHLLYINGQPQSNETHEQDSDYFINCGASFPY